MRKVIFRQPGGPEVIEIVSEPDPVPGPGEVTVRTHAVALGWPDIIVRKGVYRWMPPLPATLGFESTGRVETLGPDVTDLHVGQPVYLSSHETGYKLGCCADVAAVPATAVIPLPANMDLDQATGLGYFAIGWALLNEAVNGPTPETILVTGAAGGTGICLVQLAKLAGMKVIGTVSSAEKAEFAAKFGTDHLVNYRTESVVDRVNEITNGRGVNLILDHVLGAKFADNFKMLDEWGTVVLYGAVGGAAEGNIFQAMLAGFGKSIGLRMFSMHGYEDDLEGRRRILKRPLELLSQGKLDVPIAACFPFSDAGEAHALLESGKTMGRIILKP